MTLSATVDTDFRKFVKGQKNYVDRKSDRGRACSNAQPEDIAHLVAFLVSPAARWLIGVALRIGGGEVKSL